MKQESRFLEKLAILSLSFILVSTFAVTPALPSMMEVFSDYPTEIVEMLISVTSFANLLTIIANIWISKFLKDRTCIIIGCLLIAIGGTIPVWAPIFHMVFAGRIILGIGLGMINVKAVTLIMHRFVGKERAFLLGLRGSAEAMGNTVLTFIAGFLLLYRWNASFLIYLVILPILLLFLLFVKPRGEFRDVAEHKIEQHHPITKEPSINSANNQANQKNPPNTQNEYLGLLVKSFLLGWLFINFNTILTMRLPILMIERSLGTETLSGVVISFSLLMGVASGICFGKIKSVLGDKTFFVPVLCIMAGDLILSVAGSIPLVFLAAGLGGLANGIAVTNLLNHLSTTLPKAHVSFATTLTLVGCNLGAFSTPLFMKLVSCLKDGNDFLFLFCAGVMGVLCLFTKLQKKD